MSGVILLLLLPLPAARSPCQSGGRRPCCLSICQGAQKQALLLLCTPSSLSLHLADPHLQSSRTYQAAPLCRLAPLLAWLCHAVKHTASSCFYVSILLGCGLPSLLVCKGGTGCPWQCPHLPCTLASSRRPVIAVQWPKPETEGISSHGCINRGHVPERNHCTFYSVVV